MTVELPSSLKQYQKSAREYISKGLVRDIEFSGSTYQVLVIDSKTEDEVWAFLQLDQRGQVKDCFCSCDHGEDAGNCVHLAAAYLRIYSDPTAPLHQRFERSLWNKLCQIYADRLTDSPDQVQKISSGYYQHTSVSGKKIFSVKAKTTAAISKLDDLIEDRSQESEETSIKFSNLPQEELDLWREGKPSAELRYELSYWNDLAHWLMQLQESQVEYKIDFTYSQKQIPNYIEISFPEMDLNFYLSEANLPIIIPALETVKSPLGVYHGSEKIIEEASYQKITGTLEIKHKALSQERSKESIQPQETGYALDGWKYIPGKGFYENKNNQLLSRSSLSGQELVQALNSYPKIIQETLQGTSLSTQPVKISYTLNFDAQWNLHILGYVFTPGDLTKPHSRYFGKWVYIDEDGFYPIEDSHFDKIELEISNDSIADFLRKERAWLNEQDGFHVHLTSVESQITYALRDDNRLYFSRLLPTSEYQGKDFGPWVYIAGQGFYSKVNSYTSLPLKPETTIPVEQIPFFIRMNRAELETIPNFFSKKNPVSSVGLHIELNDDNSIQIDPVYELLPNYNRTDVIFFEDVVYVPEEGFHELAAEFRLPERFRHSVHIETANVPLFLLYDLDDLKEQSTYIDPRLIKPESLQLTALNIAENNPEKGWYTLTSGYQTERGFIPLALISTAIKQKKRFFFHDAGLIDLADKRFDWIRILPKNRIDKRTNALLLPTLEFIRLESLQQIHIASGTRDEEESQKILTNIKDFHIPSKPVLEGLLSNLRPYQQLGVNWLWFLYSHDLSGLLCDDMGLGKTHQAMALLRAVINHAKQNEGSPTPQFLVICPTSVLYHWQEKLQEFMPDVRVCVFYGSGRSLDEFHQHRYDILLTSYGIWRMEHEKLANTFFEVTILDEVQIAKNHHSRVHISLRNLNSRMRIGLTGTPIENQLRELKSLFDLVLPGYMPGESDYRELFMKPVEKENDKERIALLQRFIKPFVLRRRKQEVLDDLPEKVEEISHCSLSPEQQRMYNEVVQQSRQHVLNQMQDGTAPIPYMHIFAILSSLKQICNHPAAYLKTPEDYKRFESGKWDLFVELLNEARDSQQKVVVFTQYLAMLDIFELYLNEMGVNYATIRGSTTNRGEQVRRFNKDPSCEVFLGSLQASGLGVDLTAGSVVIHYDRWWNAARENQATDRVHRIGQKRGVEVFKLVTKGTFEERIDALISKKGKLLEEVVGVDDHRFLKQFDRDDILQLLQEVEETKENE
jgi:SNF2 family DNA or RNA helicase